MRERAGGDWARLEQLADFRNVRAFRYSIFCRGGADRKRESGAVAGLVGFG